ncbi:hypothetical protein [Enhydrobacter sp.]|jgi:hypothetical protein|uniref:hypothetical protein n=1 Tax=Enhydrobacter sp. TaxID=1894999 RepID=UPI00262508BE|nr:hypothetical protein [Enhydrobacter sp.]WIM09312.1 MAG: hypothetical protein OJF58_000263 [Enhydrobacter sp.]
MSNDFNHDRKPDDTDVDVSKLDSIPIVLSLIGLIVMVGGAALVLYFWWHWILLGGIAFLLLLRWMVNNQSGWR